MCSLDEQFSDDGGAANGRGDAKIEGSRKPKTRTNRTRLNARAGQQSEFLKVLEQQRDVKKACLATGIGRSTAYEWRESDPKFARGWSNALKYYVDDLEASTFKIAVEDVLQPLVSGGKVVAARREFYPMLMMSLLKKLKPEVYGDRANQIEGLSPDEYARRVREAGEQMDAATSARIPPANVATQAHTPWKS